MRATSHNAWLYRPQPMDRPAFRLFCLPHSGGSSALFHRWHEALPPAVELLAVQLPGRGIRFRETPYRNISPLLEALLVALRPQLDVPFAFFGHSLGALLAFELAHALRSDDLQPGVLFISACHAPQLLPTGEMLHSMPREELLVALRRINGTPAEVLVEEELLDLILPTLRADMAVYETYAYLPRAPLPYPIIACGGREDSRVTPPQLEAWREQAAGRFELHLFAGDHFYLNGVRPQLMQIIGRELAP